MTPMLKMSDTPMTGKSAYCVNMIALFMFKITLSLFDFIGCKSGQGNNKLYNILYFSI